MSNKAILFLYEGQTEEEFYKEILRSRVDTRHVVLLTKCMQGVYNLNKKVAARISHFLSDPSHANINHLYVFIACDREGPINQPPPFNDTLIRDEFAHEKRVKLIYPIIATQDLESWLFYDIENIYKFLRAPKAKRNPGKYKNVTSFNNRHLSLLFKQFGKHYQKGHRVDNFLGNLELENIISNSNELKKATEKLNKICL